MVSDSPTGPVWADAEAIVRRELKEEVAEGLIPFAGTLGTSCAVAIMRCKPFHSGLLLWLAEPSMLF